MAYMTHGVKILPEYFQAVIDGKKKFEIRRDDRDYQEGDCLFLNEFDGSTKQYTGRRRKARITYITNYAQIENYVVMSIELI